MRHGGSKDLGGGRERVGDDGSRPAGPSWPFVPGLTARDILAVDDNSANLAALEAALGDLGLRVVTARSGVEALRHLLDREVALILLDVRMPVMDGFETARYIRERERTSHIPIIFLTAYEPVDRDVLEAYSLGAVDFLFKPVVPDVLRAKVSVLIELQQRTVEVQRQADRLRELERREHQRRFAEERQRWEAVRLREESRRKDVFLAMLGHELRNPLSPVVTGIEILKHHGLPHENQRRVCASMERQVRILVRLVDDLLDVSRISQGKFELRRESFDLVAAVQQAIDGIRDALDERGQELVASLPGPVPMLGDSVRIVQLVSNLLVNANRYTPTGGRIEVAVDLEGDGDAARIVVADNGQGIPPEKIDQVFEMFAQERSGHQGLGIGLTLVRMIAELHDGEAGVVSEGPGRGSRFWVTLPLGSPEGGAEVEDAPEDSGGREPPLRILLVEDEQDVREATGTLLESWGHDVEVAASGAEALAAVRRLPPDVVLLDVGLPDMDGYEIAARIRADAAAGAVRMVAITGFGQEKDGARAQAAGFDVHLVKPATPEKLKQVLRKADDGTNTDE
ncbi:MAG TPA: response regulator [Thermoanaerobaculia bacterium]